MADFKSCINLRYASILITWNIKILSWNVIIECSIIIDLKKEERKERAVEGRKEGLL